MQESADDLFLIEAMSGGERQQVDADQMPVLAVADELLHGSEDIGIGRIAERAEQSFGLALGIVHRQATYAYFAGPPEATRSKFRTSL